MANPPTGAFLNWVADRLVSVHGESENVDFVRRLRHEASKSMTLMSNLSQNEHTFTLATHPSGAAYTDGTADYVLIARGADKAIKTVLRLTGQQADDVTRQLDASVDYFND